MAKLKRSLPVRPKENRAAFYAKQPISYLKRYALMSAQTMGYGKQPKGGICYKRALGIILGMAIRGGRKVTPGFRKLLLDNERAIDRSIKRENKKTLFRGEIEPY